MEPAGARPLSTNAIDDLADALRTYTPADEGEAVHRQRMLALLDRDGAAAFVRNHFDPGHFTASAFVLSTDGRSLLLIHHAKLDRWLQPGGHIDATDASPLAAAKRELHEEAGVTEADGPAELFDLDIHPIPANPKKAEPAHEHFDLRFLLRASSDVVTAASDALAARWVPLAEAATAEDASVCRAVKKLLKNPV